MSLSLICVINFTADDESSAENNDERVEKVSTTPVVNGTDAAIDSSSDEAGVDEVQVEAQVHTSSVDQSIEGELKTMSTGMTYTPESNHLCCPATVAI